MRWREGAIPTKHLHHYQTVDNHSAGERKIETGISSSGVSSLAYMQNASLCHHYLETSAFNAQVFK